MLDALQGRGDALGGPLLEPGVQLSGMSKDGAPVAPEDRPQYSHVEDEETSERASEEESRSMSKQPSNQEGKSGKLPTNMRHEPPTDRQADASSHAQGPRQASPCSIVVPVS